MTTDQRINENLIAELEANVARLEAKPELNAAQVDALATYWSQLANEYKVRKQLAAEPETNLDLLNELIGLNDAIYAECDSACAEGHLERLRGFGLQAGADVQRGVFFATLGTASLLATGECTEVYDHMTCSGYPADLAEDALIHFARIAGREA